MIAMLANAKGFNQDLSEWDVSHVTSMRLMFLNAMHTSFNQDVSEWNVSSVTDMHVMFCNPKSINMDLAA